MPQLLFVDACVRGAESRSRMLAERFLSSYAKRIRFRFIEIF